MRTPKWANLRETFYRATQDQYSKSSGLLLLWLLAQLIPLFLFGTYAKSTNKIDTHPQYPSCNSPLETTWGHTDSFQDWEWDHMNTKPQCNLFPEDTSLGETRSPFFLLYAAGSSLLFFWIQLRSVTHQKTFKVTLFAFASSLAMVNLVYVHSSFVGAYFSDHPGQLCAKDRDILIPFKETELEEALSLIGICPIDIIKVPNEEYSHAIRATLFPSEKADQFMSAYTHIVFLNLGCALFAILTISVLILRTIDEPQNVLHSSLADVERKEKSRSLQIRSSGSLRIMWVLFGTSLIISVYLTYALSSQTKPLSSFLSGVKKDFPQLYKTAP
eukprot:TRINITY_DN7073_c0_g1_i1.p2 TRINITY_DN7073_c0_g1~~TRINITY_DN7073_c0_g1_i1.p2  ORF type:complete len:330 (-),score=41.98 TRINITY_DN7073_c0_g1_i1:34-1023(-)